MTPSLPQTLRLTVKYSIISIWYDKKVEIVLQNFQFLDKPDARMRIVKIVISILIFALVFFALQRLLVPKYASYALEGGLIREYYDSPMDHDVIFVGDCEVYANFSTVALWRSMV